MSHSHDQLSRYVDGELDDAESETFMLHVADCTECGAALHNALQLATLEAAVRRAAAVAREPDPAAPGRPTTGVTSVTSAASPDPPRSRRRRSRWRVHYPAALAAVAAALVGL